MQWKPIFCAAVFAVVSIQTGTVFASLIIGNGSLSDTATTNDGSAFGAHDGYGVFFSMGTNNGATVKSGSVLMKNSTGSSATKSFTARLYAASTITTDPTPAPVGSSSAFEVSLAANSTGWFAIDFGAGTSLSASQNYYFAIEETVKSGTDTGIAWFEPQNSQSYTSEVGAGSPSPQFVSRLDSSTAYATMGTGTNFGFQLSTEAVPEPSSLALMSMGLASVAAAARKARKKKAETVGADASKLAV